jgi:hypothetical protein
VAKEDKQVKMSDTWITKEMVEVMKGKVSLKLRTEGSQHPPLRGIPVPTESTHN